MDDLVEERRKRSVWWKVRREEGGVCGYPGRLGGGECT